MSDAGFQRQRTAGGTITNNGAIAFNSQIVNYDSTVSYNASVFTLASSSDYYVSWFITTKTGLGIKGIDVSLVTNDTPEIVYPSTNTMKTGLLSGSAIIRSNGSTTFQLVNRTGQSIVLADNVDVTANVSIIRINGPLKSGIVLNSTNSAGVNINGGDVIPFDTIFTQINNTITNSDGTISITSASRYMIDWYVSLDGSLDATAVKFNLVHVATPDSTIIGTSESPVVLQGGFYGNALINVETASTEVPYIIRLVNASVDSTSTLATVTLSNIGIQASIRITEI